MVISDGFLINKNLSREEKQILKKCLDGWGLSNLTTKGKFYQDLKNVGFRNIKYYDKFDSIKKTRDRLYRCGILGYLFSLVLFKLKLVPKCVHDNTIMCIYQKKLFSNENNLATYGVFVAEK